MKIRTIIGLVGSGLIMGACVLEGLSAGALIGFVAEHAATAGETARLLKESHERYAESQNRREKIVILADLTCHFRRDFPDQLDWLRTRLKEEGVNENLLGRAQKLAYARCAKRVPSQ